MRPALFAAALLALAGSLQAAELGRSAGQTVYVPVYSHIWHGNLDSRQKPQQLSLSAMLSIRNTDPDAAMTVLSVR